MEQIKELCFFMICGQTLLYFQSGKKYEKICRMILELLVLAGIVGMVLNFLQSLGWNKGEMEAAGGAVAGMQRSMEEALSRQLGSEEFQENFLSEDVMESLIEKHTENEIKSRYNKFAEQYGLKIERMEQEDDKLRVFLKETEAETDGETEEDGGERGEQFAENPAKIDEIERVEIGEIALSEREENGTDTEDPEGNWKEPGIGEEELKNFRRQLALVFAMEEDKLEVILID